MQVFFSSNKLNSQNSRLWFFFPFLKKYKKLAEKAVLINIQFSD